MTPFARLTAVSVVVGYLLLGACWLLLKTEGELQRKARHWAMVMLIALAICFALVSIATLSVDPRVTQRWGVSMTHIDLATFLRVAPVPRLGMLLTVWLFNDLFREPVLAGIPHWRPYVLAAGIFLTGYLGLAVSIFPRLVPFEYTIWETAARDNALGLMLVGVRGRGTSNTGRFNAVPPSKATRGPVKGCATIILRRQSRSAHIVDTFFAWVGEQRQRVDLLPSNPLSKALVYARDRELALKVFPNDGAVQIDTDHLERALVGERRRRGRRCGSCVRTRINTRKRSSTNGSTRLFSVPTRTAMCSSCCTNPAATRCTPSNWCARPRRAKTGPAIWRRWCSQWAGTGSGAARYRGAVGHGPQQRSPPIAGETEPASPTLATNRDDPRIVRRPIRAQ